MDELMYCIWLCGIKGLGYEKITALHNKFESFENVYKSAKSAWEDCTELSEYEIAEMDKRDVSAAENILSVCEKQGINIITCYDKKYPQMLMNISDPPVILYIKGAEVNFNDIVPVAVVGSRRPSSYGSKMGFKIGYELAKEGAVVVSGMARGIDSLSQRGAIKAGGTTIAVLGTGCDIAYPSENKDLKKEIESNGCVISEFPPGTKALAHNFPRRNRIMSGMSVGVVLVEGEASSGTLITARLALEQGREVFCIPGNVDSALSYAPNMLIKEGAALITCARDVLDALGGEYELETLNQSADRAFNTAVQSLAPEQRSIVSMLDKGTPTHIDDICLKCNLGIAEVNQNIMMLEINGIVKSMPGRYYLLK